MGKGQRVNIDSEMFTIMIQVNMKNSPVNISQGRTFQLFSEFSDSCIVQRLKWLFFAEVDNKPKPNFIIKKGHEPVFVSENQPLLYMALILSL